jgi:hypothetical protein
MEQAFRAILHAATAVTNLAPTSRINFGERPQGKPLPAIAMTVTNNNRGHTLKGADGLFVGRVQVDCYGDTYADAKNLSLAALAALDSYRGGNFSSITDDGSQDLREGGGNEADRPYRVKIDFITNWRP